MELINNIGNILGVGATLDADLAAVVARGQALGYGLPTGNRQAKDSALVQALKAAGLWTGLDIWQVYCTNGDSDYATLNWKAPTLLQATKVNSPTFTANQGFSFNGTTNYVNTNFVPSAGVNYTAAAASFFAYVHNAADAVMGARTAANTNRNVISAAAAVVNTLINRDSDADFLAPAQATQVGFYQAQLTATPEAKIFKDGTVQANDLSVGGGRPTFSMFVGAQNFGGVAVGFATGRVSMFGAGASLAGQEATLYNIWNTYFTGL